ncbi:MAG: hypothetical protein MUF62_13195 [Chitinophagaceae bacterium]|jgi:hypothetical protein|nr:hypothetical protein [Chitinophagaceae bacterium]
MANFTPEDLLLYHYHELPPADMERIAAALENNWPLQEKYRVIVEAARRLDKSMLPPRPETIRQVLDYADAAARKAALS